MASRRASETPQCLFCLTQKCDVLDGTDERSSKPNSLEFWICSKCRAANAPGASALETAFLKDFLSVPNAPGTTVSVAAHKDKNSRSLTVTMTTTCVPAEVPQTEKSTKDECKCQACLQRRQLELAHDADVRELQKIWLAVRHTVRQMYRDAVTAKAKKLDRDKLRDMVEKLCARDAHQLYERLESQAREHVMEVKVTLLHVIVAPKENSSVFCDARAPAAHDRSLSAAMTRRQAGEFVRVLLGEFVRFEHTVRHMTALFLQRLEEEHLSKFNVTWELVNRHLFAALVLRDPLIETSLPIMLSQLGYTPKKAPNSLDEWRRAWSHTSVDETVPDARHEWLLAVLNGSAPCSCDCSDRSHVCTERAPIEHVLVEELEHVLAKGDVGEVLGVWPIFELLIDDASKSWPLAREKMSLFALEQKKQYKATLRRKQKMLKEDLVFFKEQRRLLEQYVEKRKRPTKLLPKITEKWVTLRNDAKMNGKEETQRAPLRDASFERSLDAFEHDMKTMEEVDAKTSSTKKPDVSAFTSSIRAFLTSAARVSGRAPKPHQVAPSALCERCGEKWCECEECALQHVVECGLGEEEDVLDSAWDEEEVLRSFRIASDASESESDNSGGENEQELLKLLESKEFADLANDEGGDGGLALLAERMSKRGTVSVEQDNSKRDVENAYGDWRVDSDPAAALFKASLAICHSLEKRLAKVEAMAHDDEGDCEAVKPKEDWQAIKPPAREPPPLTAPTRRRPSSLSCADEAIGGGGVSKKSTTGASTAKIPPDILEMLKDERLKRALSVAAKRVKDRGGGPQEFLHEAEEIKKNFVNKKQPMVKEELKPDDHHHNHEHGHRCERHDGEESEQDDEEKKCDCCYCEVFGHAANHLAGSAAANQLNLMRERLRRKLKQKKGEQPEKMPNEKSSQVAPPLGNESVDALLEFINGERQQAAAKAAVEATNGGEKSAAKAAKRQRQKEKKQEMQKAKVSTPVTVRKNGTKDAAVEQEGRENEPTNELVEKREYTNGECERPHAADDVFKPCDDSDLDEEDREVEIFKRFVLDSQPLQERAKIHVDIGEVAAKLVGQKQQR